MTQNTSTIIKWISIVVIVFMASMFIFNLPSTQAVEGPIIIEPSELSITGTASVVEGNVSDCFDTKNCRLRIVGPGTSTVGDGELKATIRVFAQHTFSNGKGGFCYSFSGAGRFKIIRQGIVKFRLVGTVCDIAAASFDSDFEVFGNYVTFNATRDFENSRGYGIFSGNIDRSTETFDYTLDSTIVSAL
jgi:hypothetical protein